jgi:hypothetical protein
MRLVRPVALALMLVLALALAPAAGAHEDGEPTHRDTGAELARADINRALAVAGMADTTAADLPQFLPTASCGPELTTDDTVHAVFPSSVPQIKVVYAYASDQTDNSALWRDALQADVSRIQQYLALQSGGRRALRFDMGTNCGPQYVDIQVVHLSHTRAYYDANPYNAADDANDYDNLLDDIAPAIGASSGPRDVFVLAEGLTAETHEWGIAGIRGDDSTGPGNASNTGGLTATMWTNPNNAPNPSGWQPTVMLHEITHNLGGVQQSAPHKTAGWHCWDGADVMCYDDLTSGSELYTTGLCPTGANAIPQTYDCGHDDYYNPDPAPGSYLATHWNVYRSAFMGRCSELGMACGDNIVPTVPVNTVLPTVTGTAQRGGLVTGTAGTWFNNPYSYVLQWQRGADDAWSNIPGATTPAYQPSVSDVGSMLRMVVTATNEDGSAIVASGPTAAVADVGVAKPVVPATSRPTRLSIALRDHARHARGTLAATVATVPAGREVRTAAARLRLAAGTWRLRLCAGPKRGSLRCALTKRVHTHTPTVRLPAARVLVASAKGALRITAAVVDGRRRVRAQGSAAGA